MQVAVAVSLTVFAPRLLQVKLVLSRLKVTGPQLSEEPLSICEAVIVALPLAFRFTVKFLVAITGGVLSFTLMVKLQVTVPQVLVADKVTLVTPLLNMEPLPLPDPLPVVAPEKL